MTDFSKLPHLNAVAPCHTELSRKCSTWQAFCGLLLAVMVLISVWVSILVIGGLLWSESSYVRGCRFPFYDPRDVYQLSLCLVAWNTIVWGCFVLRDSRSRKVAKVAALVSIILWMGFVSGIEIGRSLPLDDESHPVHVPQP